MSKVSTAQENGPRPTQEDFISVLGGSKPGSALMLSVFDGHSGAQTAKTCFSHVGPIFEARKSGSAEQFLFRLVAELDGMTRENVSGSTASCVLIEPPKRLMTAAILGDSPVVVLDKNGKVHIGPIHNVKTNLIESEAAKHRGGVIRADGCYVMNPSTSKPCGIQITRALGDLEMGVIVSKEPEIFSVADPVWILVASDGLLDHTIVGNKNKLRAFIDYVKSLKPSADDLIVWARRRGFYDNTSAVVWDVTK